MWRGFVRGKMRGFVVRTQNVHKVCEVDLAHLCGRGVWRKSRKKLVCGVRVCGVEVESRLWRGVCGKNSTGLKDRVSKKKTKSPHKNGWQGKKIGQDKKAN